MYPCCPFPLSCSLAVQSPVLLHSSLSFWSQSTERAAPSRAGFSPSCQARGKEATCPTQGSQWGKLLRTERTLGLQCPLPDALHTSLLLTAQPEQTASGQSHFWPKLAAPGLFSLTDALKNKWLQALNFHLYPVSLPTRVISLFKLFLLNTRNFSCDVHLLLSLWSNGKAMKIRLTSCW